MNKIFSILIIFFVFISSLHAQIATSSPYSRFGLGDLQNNVLPAFNVFGGSSIALNNKKTVNPSNPATYALFGRNSFLLSTGGWHQTTSIQNLDNNQIVNNNSFSHLVLGFPLAAKLGVSIGMLPFSNTGYQINTYDEVYDANMSYYGDGGLSKMYFGGAYRISNELSIGLNSSYLFGGLNRRKQLVYADDTFLNSRSNSKINLRGYYYELGFLYKKALSFNDEISIGISFNNNSTIRAKKTELIESFEFSGILEVPKDTFLSSVEWGDVVLPKCFSGGFAFQNKKWHFIGDYNIQNWKEYIMFNEHDNLANSMRVSTGLQYTPDYNSITKYYKRIDYRIGASYANMPLQFEDNQLKEMTLNFGFGIPLRKSRTKYDFSCILGQRGSTDNDLIKEQFVRLGLSVSYDGIWFVKRKYD